ncbi:MAG TPA: hypothetical protein VFS26_07625 [Solirubrobacterales bacterium]|nr:hypothetical protein [Solirubrobacterales bacterium]
MYKSGMLELAREVVRLLEEEARQPLGAGWAELRIEEDELGPTVFLEPMKIEAAPLEIYFDSEELAVCSPGRHGMVVEFFSDDQGEIKDLLRALAAAAVAGGYTERVSEGGAVTMAQWPGPDGPQRATRSGLGRPQPAGEAWREVTYDPY